jgi:two-component system, LytTR family, response regulator
LESENESRLILKTRGRVVFLDPSEIAWIEACANYVRLHTLAGSYLLRAAIGRMSERLDPARFIRIHRSFIVNVARIREFQACNSGEFIVILRDGKELPCSRSYHSVVRKLWSTQISPINAN